MTEPTTVCESPTKKNEIKKTEAKNKRPGSGKAPMKKEKSEEIIITINKSRVLQAQSKDLQLVINSLVYEEG